jgi:glycosyltransferase involved in cell wall biosynthesis
MLSVIIPAFNEESRLPLCLEKTLEFLSGQDYQFEIIVVNDGSTDNTSSIAEGFSARFPQVKLIELSSNRGKGFAVKTGMLKASGDLRLFMDADYAVPAGFIDSFITVIKKGYDIVIGARGLKETRIIKHQSFTRELAGKMFGKLQKLILGIPYYDTQCGFKLFTAESSELLFNQINYECSYFDAEVMYLAYKKKLRIKEMPVDWTHDGSTRMPVGLIRTIDLIRKLFRLKSLHR